jgi:hypothetical protein
LTTVLFCALILAYPAAANTYLFATTSSAQSVKGDPLDITGLIVLSAGDLQITLDSSDTPGTETAALYGITFQVDQDLSIASKITPDSISTTEATLSRNGTYTTTTPSSATLVSTTTWNLTGTQSGSSTSLQFSIKGTGQPHDMLVGPPGTGGLYHLTGSSFTNHEPFYWETATFDIKVPGLLASDTIPVTSLNLLLGTTPNTNSEVTLTLETGDVPEPDTLVFLGSGVLLIALGVYGRRRKR